MEEQIPRHKILEYEINSSLIAPWISWGWMQDLIAKYFAWKVNKKYQRYQARKECREYLKKKNLI